MADLRGMSTDDLIAAHDRIAGQSQSVETADNYRAGLARRDADRQTWTMLKLTWWIAGLTVANVLLVAYAAFH